MEKCQGLKGEFSGAMETNGGGGRNERSCEGGRVEFRRRENVFELVSRVAVSRKRRVVSRRWPNITQRSLFRAGGEVGARNRNDLEHTGPPCSIVALPRGRHFHCTTGAPLPLLFDRTWRRRETNREILRGWSIDIPRGSATFFPPFLAAARKARLVPRDLMHLETQGRNTDYLSLSLCHAEI